MPWTQPAGSMTTRQKKTTAPAGKPAVRSRHKADDSPVEESKAVETHTGNAPQVEQKSSNWPYVILLLAAGIAAIWLGAPDSWRQKILLPIEQMIEGSYPPATKQTTQEPSPSLTTPETEEPDQQLIDTEKLADTEPSAPEAEKSTEKEVPAASAKDVQLMLSSIQQLRSEIQQLRQEQAAEREANRNAQTLQLKSRLNEIVQPDTHLAQLIWAWGDIALLPVLDEEKRKQASEMHAKATAALKNLRIRRQQLEELLRALTPEATASPNLLTEEASDSLWTGWISEQFSLRRAPTERVRTRNHLRSQLADMQRQLEIEVWPQAETLRRLRIECMDFLGETDEKPGLAAKLPLDFSDINQDIPAMKQLAQSWLEQI